MSQYSANERSALNRIGQCLRVLLISASLVSLASCFSLTRREIERDVSDSPTLVTLNAYTFHSIFGLKIIRSYNYRGGSNSLSSDQFVDIERFTVGNINVAIDTPSEARDAVEATVRSFEKADKEENNINQLKRAIGIYARFHESVDAAELLPSIRIRVIPYNVNYSNSDFYASTDMNKLELTLVVSPPAAGNNAARLWAGQVISLMAHELSHSRSLLHPGLFPNAVSDETIAHLIEYQIRWEIEGGDLPAQIVGVSGDDMFQQRMLDLTVSQIARKAAVLHPSNAGSILAQAIIWKNLGVAAVPISDTPKFDVLRGLCITYSKNPPDFTVS